MAVLRRAGRYHVVREAPGGKDAPAPLQVKQVLVEDRRYIVCRHEDQAKKDAADREAIIAALREQLKQGDKSLVGNRGYRKYLKGDGSRFEIDEAKRKAEARYDGKWVLRTNTRLSAAGPQVQTALAGRGPVPRHQVPARDSAPLPPARCHHPRTRLLLVPRAAPAPSAARAPAGGRAALRVGRGVG